MTDPVGVTADPRKVLMMGDEPDTVAELMALVDLYATAFLFAGNGAQAGRDRVEAAIRAALEAKP